MNVDEIQLGKRYWVKLNSGSYADGVCVGKDGETVFLKGTFTLQTPASTLTGHYSRPWWRRWLGRWF